MEELGLVKPPRDFSRYHALLRERGLLSDTNSDTSVTLRDDDLDRSVSAIRHLFTGAGRTREYK